MENEMEMSISEVKLSYHPAIKPSDLVRLTNAHEVHKLLLANWNLDTTYLIMEVKIIFLNRAKGVVHIHNHSTGTNTNSTISPQLIILLASQLVAESVIVAINHPASSLFLSAQEHEVATALKAALKLINSKLIDFIVFDSEKYYSLAEDKQLDSL